MRSKKAIYNVLTSLLLQLVVITYGFLIPKAIIKTYGSNVNGLITSITQFLGYIALLESGFGPVVKAILYKPIANKDNNEIRNILKSSEKFFRTISIVFVFYIIILCFLYPILVKNNFGYLYTVSLLLIISTSIFSEYYFGMTYKLFLQANQKNYVVSIIQIVTYLLNIIIILILVRINISIHLIKLISAILFILRPIIQNIYIKRKYNINLNEADSNYSINQKWEGLSQHIAYVIHRNTDVAILTIFSDLSTVSIYAVYNMIVAGINSIINTLSDGIISGFGDMIAKNEHENLKCKFNLYEVLYFSITTIIYTCTLILILPFISVYTRGITDADYIRKSFGYLIVISEYIWAIRLPYYSLVLAAGKFKQTRNGAWIECILNILFSILLVRKLGLIGVAIGTMISMLIRTIEIIFFTNKKILKRSISISFSKIICVIIETLLIFFVFLYIPLLESKNYISFIINGFIVLSVSTIIVLIINGLFCKSEFIEALKVIKNFLKREKKHAKT